ncbi:MAG: hypothetical protein V4667_04395 [Bacteroidota bacterium]
MEFRRLIKEYAEIPVSHSLLMDALVEYNRPNDKISELLKSGALISVKRGLYLFGTDLDLAVPEPFLIANHLRGPSYVSLESALSYWGLIPERVHEITSATLKTSKKYNAEAGRFSFYHLPSPYYSFGIQSVQLTPKQTVLMASREKAVCDKVILTSGVLLRSVSQTKDFLLNDMRMDEEILQSLNTTTIASWIDDAPKSNSIAMLIKTLNTL